MSTKAVKLRIRRNKLNRYMRHNHGPNWRSICDMRRVVVTPIDLSTPRRPTVEELRLAHRRANPQPMRSGFVKGVSPNAVVHQQ